MKKRILSIVLTALMLLGISAVGVSAETVYDLYVGEVTVTSSNATDVLGDGTVSFDADSNTLTLNNASIEGYSKELLGTGIFAYGMNLTIELVGNNTITVADAQNEYNDGINVIDGSLCIKGIDGGSLSVNVGDATESVYGIFVTPNMHYEDAYFNVTDADITVSCGDSLYTTGIYSNAPLSVSGGSLNVTTGSADMSIGILTEPHYVYDVDTSDFITMTRGNINFTNDAKIKVTAGKGTTISQGINCYGDFVVDKAMLDITGGVSDNTSNAINASGYVKFVSGKVTAFIEDGTQNCAAIVCNSAEEEDETTGEVTSYGGIIEIFDGADVNVNTGNAYRINIGVSAHKHITVHGGKLTIVIGGALSDKEPRCYGMTTQTNIYINGGTVSISVPDRTDAFFDFAPVSLWYGGVYLADNITVTGTKTPFISGAAACAQADPNVPVVFTDNAQNGEKLLGDADKDGQLNIKDATAIQKNIAGLLEFDSEQTSLADFNADSEVNIKDATAIQKKIAGIS